MQKTYLDLKMLFFFSLLFHGLCSSAILRSKDLQAEVSSDFFTPRDLLKTRLVDNSWISVEKIFKKITPKAGLFEHRKTNECVFEAKENSWLQIDILEKLQSHHENDSWPFQNVIEEKNWSKMFLKLIHHYWWRYWRFAGHEFLKALAEIIEPDARDEFERTSVHHATLYEDDELLEILLKRPDANPNMKDRWGVVPLHLAVGNIEIDAMQILLKYGAEIDAVDNSLKTPLMLAIEKKNFQSVKILLSHKANPNMRDEGDQTALHYAARHGDTGMIIIPILLNYGVEIDAESVLLQTPLIIAAIYENWYSAIVLLNYKANPTAKDRSGKTALHMASECNEVQVIETLLKHGAKIDAQDNELKTPLMCAVARMSCDSVKVLLNHKSNPNLKTKAGATALHIAAQNGEEDIIETLLNNGAHIDATDNLSQTPLIYAAIYMNYDSAAVLLSNGANVNLKDENGSSALRHAVSAEAFGIVDILLEYGAKMDQELSLSARTVKRKRSMNQEYENL